jgi:hypothetical protein
LAPVDRTDAVRTAWQAGGATVLDTAVDNDGVIIA